MLLLVSKAEFKKLLQKNFIMPLGQGKYRLDCFGQDSTIIKLDLEVQIDSDETPKKTGNFTENQMKTAFAELYKIFPKSDSFAHFPISRTMSGKSEEFTFKNYCTLIESTGFEFKDILDALKYEVWWRKKISIAENNNKLTFMKGFDSWLNSPENIKVQLSEMEKDEEYKKLGGLNITEYFEHHDKFRDL